jgi:plasmid stabilization system protein ParE
MVKKSSVASGRRAKTAAIHERFYYEVWNFIALDNVAADRVVLEINDAIRHLLPFPLMGHSRPDLTSRPIRFLSVRDILIAYAPDESPLPVLAILHGRRNPRVIAAFLRART